jgi:hypothetical protein
MGSIQPLEDKGGATWMKKERLRSSKPRLTVVGICCADHVTPLYPQKLALTSPTSGGLSVGIVRWRTSSHGVLFVIALFKLYLQCLVLDASWLELITLHNSAQYLYTLVTTLCLYIQIWSVSAPVHHSCCLRSGRQHTRGRERDDRKHSLQHADISIELFCYFLSIAYVNRMCSCLRPVDVWERFLTPVS